MAAKYVFIGEPNLDQRAVPIAAVEDLALVHGDLVSSAMRLDVGDKRIEIGALKKRKDVRQQVKFDHGYCPRRDCDLGCVVSSAMASIRITPAIDGVATKPMMRRRAMSAGDGVMVPRLNEPTIALTASACGSADVMGVASADEASALRISSSSLSLRFAVCSACRNGRMGAQAFMVSVVNWVQPRVASHASRSTRSTLGRSRWIWISSSATDFVSAMVLRSSRHRRSPA